MVTMAIIAGAECVLKANRSVLAPYPAGRMSLTAMRVIVFKRYIFGWGHSFDISFLCLIYDGAF